MKWPREFISINEYSAFSVLSCIPMKCVKFINEFDQKNDFNNTWHKGVLNYCRTNG